MRGGHREGAGRPANPNSNTKMFFLRVSEKLFSLLTNLTPDEKREVLENAAKNKIEKNL